VKQKYRYGTSKYISFSERFHFHLKFLLLFIFVLLLAVAALIYSIHTQNRTPQTPVSKATVKSVNFDTDFFSTPYFKFSDSGKWNFIKSQSTAKKFVFHKYLPNSDLVQHQLIVYINDTPLSLELAASRVLPVGEGSTLLCDPEQGQFRVVIAKAGGDYNLKLKRADGTTANYIIIYQNQKIDPDSDTAMQIAETFQAL
jgi:hypothetical protein